MLEVNRCPQLPLFSTCFANSFLGFSANTLTVAGELVFGPPQKSLKKHFRKTLGANFFGLRFKLIQTAFAAVGTRTGPVPEVTGFLGFHGMGEELREGDRRV